jgi:ribosomal protein S18 acetylase RimI-like enzyme
MQEVEYRLADLARPRDRGAFLELLDHYSRDPFGGNAPLPEEIARVLPERWAELPGAFSMLAWAAERPVGLANCLTSFSTFRALPRINIHDLVVHADSRGLGVGRGLIEAVCQESERRGACQVTLEVLAGNQRARELYVRAGFRGIEIPLRESSYLFGTRPIDPTGHSSNAEND